MREASLSEEEDEPFFPEVVLLLFFFVRFLLLFDITEECSFLWRPEGSACKLLVLYRSYAHSVNGSEIDPVSGPSMTAAVPAGTDLGIRSSRR